MKKYLFIIMLLAFNSAFADNARTRKDFIGIWAMTPLKGGIANVVQYTEDESILYQFKCDWDNKKVYFNGVQANYYEIKGNKIFITVKGEDKPYSDLKIDRLTSGTMELSYDDDSTFSFFYIKMDYIMPLCPLYWDSAAKSKE